MERRIAGVVLAAGASSRMGQPKSLLTIEGSSYLTRIIANLGVAGASPIVVVLGCGAGTVRAQVELDAATVVENAEWAAGMLGSIHAAIHALLPRHDVEGMLLIPVDQPRVGSGTMRAVLDSRATVAALIAVPTYNGERGHPVLFAREIWPALLRAPANEGARHVVRGCGDSVARVAVDDPWILVDADTPAQHTAMVQGVPESSPDDG